MLKEDDYWRNVGTTRHLNQTFSKKHGMREMKEMDRERIMKIKLNVPTMPGENNDRD